VNDSYAKPRLTYPILVGALYVSRMYGIRNRESEAGSRLNINFGVPTYSVLESQCQSAEVS
jgi:hypothetical protein